MTPNMKMTDKPEHNDVPDMQNTPLGDVLQRIDELIHAGGASKNDLMSLKSDLEGIQADIEGEESGEGEQMPSQGHGGSPKIMIALGFKNHKGAQ